MNIPSFDEFWKSIGEDKMKDIVRNNLSVLSLTAMPGTTEELAAIMTKVATYSVLTSRDLLETYHTWLTAKLQEVAQ